MSAVDSVSSNCVCELTTESPPAKAGNWFGRGSRLLVPSMLLRHGSLSALWPPRADGFASTSSELEGVLVPSGATSSAVRNGALSSASTLITLMTPPGGKLARTPGCGPIAGGGPSAQAASASRDRIIRQRRIVILWASREAGSGP